MAAYWLLLEITTLALSASPSGEQLAPGKDGIIPWLERQNGEA